MSNHEIRRMTAADLDTVGRLHLESFPGFFLSFLGHSFLRQLYTGVLNDNSGIAFVSEIKGRLTGFVAGTAQPAGFYRRLLTGSWWRFAIASLPPILRRPTIIPRLFRALTMPSRATSGERRGLLMSVAVLPAAQGSGVGCKLVRRFLDEAKQRGLNSVELTTDKMNNDGANRFYQNLGFVYVRAYTTPEGREMNEYEIELASLPGSQLPAKRS